MQADSREATTAVNRPKLNITYSTFPINDPPFIGNLGGDTASYLEDAGPVVIDQGTLAIVTDPDSPNFAFGAVTASIATGGVADQDVLSIRTAGDINFDGTSVRYQGIVIGTATGGTNGAPLVVSLNLATTTAGTSALLNAITYSNVSQNPTTTQRKITFALNDGDGTANGGGDTVTVTATVNLTAVNDPPAIININEDDLIYLENSGLQRLDQDTPAAIGDLDSLDFGGGSMTVSLGATTVAAQDTLSILPTGPITFDGTNVLFQGTSIGVVTGGTNGANLVISFNASATKPAVAALAAAIAYRNSSDAPTGSQRIATFTINDGDGTANGGQDSYSDFMSISVRPVNDAPLLSNLANDLLAYSEGTGLQKIDQGTAAAISDLDSLDLDTGTLSVSITSGGAAAEDVLSVKHVGSGAGQIGFAGNTVSFAGTAIGTATGGTNGSALVITLNSSATLPAVSALLAAVAYNNTSNTPSTTQRLVSFTITDGDGTANGGADTATAIATISVTAINGAPVITNLSGDVLSYLESSGTQLLDQGSAAVVTDADSANFNGGSVTVSISSGGVPAQDVLSIAPSADITLLGTNVRFQGTTIGTFSGGTNGVNLLINLNSAATPTTVTSLLRALTYSNASIAPNLSPRTVNVAISDGTETGSVAMTVNILPINAAPIVNSLNGDTVAYIEDSGAQRLDQATSVGVTDIDSPDFDTGSLTVSVAVGGVAAEDVVSILSAGDIGVSGSNVTYQGTVIGTVTGGSNGAALVVSFNSSATLAVVSSLVHAVAYANTSNTPNTTARQITLLLNDGDGAANGGANTSLSTVTINITSSNDAPVISNLSGNVLSYTENQTDQQIDQGIVVSVTDVDSSNFDGGLLTVSIASGGVAAQDVLSIRNVGDISFNGTTVIHQGTAIGTVTGGTNGAALVITLNTSATPASVSGLLNAITYTNSSNAPTTTDRVVTFSLNDGDGVANGGTNTGTATATVHVAAVNDAPALIGLNGGSIFNQAGTPVVIDADATLLDFELSAANNHAGASLSIARQSGANADDVFSFSTAGAPGFTVGAGILQSGGSTFATFTNSAGTLSIQFAQRIDNRTGE